MTSIEQPLQRRKLSDEIQDRLLELIKLEGLQPGEILPSERELMRRYNVGRPAIREAMQNLQRMGLVSIRHGGRPRVAEPSVDRMIAQMSESMHHVLSHSNSTMDHLKEARATFEAEMARIAARNRTDDDLTQLHSILAKQHELDADPAGFIKCDGEFHRAIAAASGNPIFESLSFAMFNWMARFHSDQVRKPGLEKLTLKEHEEILAAISKKDAVKAGVAMRDHLERANALYHKENL